MRHGRIDVGEEVVFVRNDIVPKGVRFLGDQLDLDDRLDALEAVLPRRDETQRGAVLRRKRVAVDARCEEGERIHRLREGQPLVVGPRIPVQSLLPWSLVGTVEAEHPHEARRREGLHEVEERFHRKARPRDRHSPGFDASVSVEPLFPWKEPHQLLHVVSLWPRHQPSDLDPPGVGRQPSRQKRRAPLVLPELVEVVVRGGHGLGGERTVEDEGRVALRREERSVRGRSGRPPCRAGGGLGGGGDRRGDTARRAGAEGCRPGKDRRSSETGCLEKPPPVEILRLRSRFPVRDLPSLRDLDQHRLFRCSSTR